MARPVHGGDLVPVEGGVTEGLDGAQSAHPRQQRPVALAVRHGHDADAVRPHVGPAAVGGGVGGLAVGSGVTEREHLPAVGVDDPVAPGAGVAAMSSTSRRASSGREDWPGSPWGTTRPIRRSR